MPMAAILCCIVQACSSEGIAGTTLLFVYASVTPGILLSGRAAVEAAADQRQHLSDSIPSGSFTASGGSSDTRHMASLSMDNSLAHVSAFNPKTVNKQP